MSLTLTRLAEMAKENPNVAFDSIAHLIDLDLLRWAHGQLRKDAAAGTDGMTWAAYEQNLEDNLLALHERLRTKQYRAQPVRRAYVPKETGERRPIGIPAHEDKIVQRAAVAVLEAVYEQDFLDSSYGFRRRRSAHDALAASWKAIMDGKVNVVLDADLEAFFDSLDRRKLMGLVRHRIRDGSVLRLIAKWLHAGVLEQGRWHLPERGSPQGSVISPLLANVYLHYVLDVWIEREVKRRCRGCIYLYRYCDDFILGFELEDDAERVMRVLPQRLAKWGLRLNPQKTRMIRFGQRAWEGWRRGGPKPATYDFLGFTHSCATSRQGKFVVRRKTARKRFSRSLRRVWDWCKHNRHRPVPEQCLYLGRALRGHYRYYGLPGNSDGIARFYYWVRIAWHRWLSRRSQRGYIPWTDFDELLRRHPLPLPRMLQKAPS